MSDYENPNEADYFEVTRRLQQFGSAPLEAEVAARALGRVRAGRAATRRVARTKLLSAAAVAAFLASGVGLAAADVLPPSAQDVAHNALKTVGVHVPPGHDRYNDATACPGGPYANHGAYVRAHPEDPNAGKSPCGKPTRAVNPSSPGAENDNEGKGAGNGPPPRAQAKKDQAKKNQGKNDQATNDEKDRDESDGGALQPSNTVPKSPPSTHAPASTTTPTTIPRSTTTTSTTTPESTTTSTLTHS
ncbi:MAG: hypothetical protein M3Q30_06935 [Actinomycetota bacterium]|nr:hypothetical protein [Actinomycetota bacterium]